MREKLLEIIEHFGVIHQLKYFQSEVFELNEAIINAENYEFDSNDSYTKICCNMESYKDHIAEELADNYVMVYQFPKYYYEKLDVHNIAPYEFKTDNYEVIDDILIYLKNFQKEELCKFTCTVAIVEEREQEWISEYSYELITEAVDNIIYKLKSIQVHYGITDKEVEEIMNKKIDRTIKRIKEGYYEKK